MVQSPPPTTVRQRNEQGHPVRRRMWLGAGVAGTLLAGAIVGAVSHAAGNQTCSGPGRELTVSAAPEITAVVTEAARLTDQRGDSRVCVHTVVRAEDPASVSWPVTGRTVPDVWIPDSSIWLRRSRAEAAKGAPAVAQSPIVLALRRPAAQRRGWPERPLRLGDLLGGARQPPRLHLSEARSSAAASVALVGLQAALAGRDDSRSRLAAVLRDAAMTPRGASTVTGLDTDPTGIAVTTEQELWTRNNGAPADSRLVPVYPSPAGAVLDYPFAVLNERRSADAQRLLGTLRSAVGQSLARALGFRAVDGSAGDTLAAGLGTAPPAIGKATAPNQQAIDAAVRTADVITRGSRLLAVIDVSGSMGTPVPGTGRTRLQLTQEAAASGLTLYPDNTEIGLWSFATHLTSTTDYKQLVAIGPLTEARDGGTQRSALGWALADLRPVAGGGTGLYDTTLAAVRTVRRGWQPDKANSVVVLTDGRNDDRAGLGLGDLLTELMREQDLRRPVPVITILYGPDGDEQALRAISAATGGTTYLARDPRRIGQVFLDAIGRRSCRPGC